MRVVHTCAAPPHSLLCHAAVDLTLLQLCLPCSLLCLAAVQLPLLPPRFKTAVQGLGLATSLLVAHSLATDLT